MTPTWDVEPPPSYPATGALGWLRVVLRGLPLAVVVFGGLGFLLLVRAIEFPLFRSHRPWTPFITQVVCKAALAILGFSVRVKGPELKGDGAIVANHASWLDVFALNAARRIYFVAKSEVAGWPGIGWLARATGTVFIRRAAQDAALQRDIFNQRLDAGHRLLFFPEGTSTDGRRVLAFKPTLFAAFADRGHGAIQPATVVYHAPENFDPRFYGWWGDMTFGGHLLAVLAAPKNGSVEVIFHDPLEIANFPDRKALAKAAEIQVRSAMPEFGYQT